MSSLKAAIIPVVSRSRGTSDPLPIALRVQRLQALAKLMDEAIRIPLLGTQIGLDALIGLVPGLGDAVTTGIAFWIVNEARLMGVPRWLLARMAWNVGVDFFGGAIPLAGDLFDVYFRCNRRNVDLLTRWLRRKGHLSDSD